MTKKGCQILEIHLKVNYTIKARVLFMVFLPLQKQPSAKERLIVLFWVEGYTDVIQCINSWYSTMW